jgi:hypothetical protein
MTTLVNNVLMLGRSPALYVAVANSPFHKRMTAAGITLAEMKRIDGLITKAMSVSNNASDLWHWWPITTLGWPSTDNAVLEREFRASWGRFEVYVADLDLVWRARREMQGRIVKAAQAKIGSGLWSFDATNGVFGKGTNKCMLFVHDVLLEAGSDVGTPHGIRHASPPTAGDWATSGTSIPAWRGLYSWEDPEPGDVVAQRGNYSDATGHVMTVGPAGFGSPTTFIGTSDAPGVTPPGAVVQIPPKTDIVDPEAKAGPELFRRWDPLV